MTVSSTTAVLNWRRVGCAFAVAIAADAIQVFLGPLGWTFFDEIIDVITMILLCVLIGFHPLFLPTFLLEVIPIVDMLPTWSACVALVVALRRKRTSGSGTPPRISTPPDVIDV